MLGELGGGGGMYYPNRQGGQSVSQSVTYLRPRVDHELHQLLDLLSVARVREGAGGQL